ncbi:PQQ-binding-like beta-propeller repeat protein [Ideonella sp. DXS29W]|uniref:PQQ-binding-like beta-propeller repeat protein n=1 Tax=Ideonella lacteola TaxID=2984193 RepID=A0ABU9BVA9_9BURK
MTSRIPSIRSLTVGLSLVALAVSAAQAQWAQEGQNAARSYANAQEKTLSRDTVARLGVLWERQVGQFYASEITQSNAHLPVCSNLVGAAALAPDTGNSQWTFYAGAGDCATPASFGDRTYLTSYKLGPPRLNRVTALNTATGTLAWQTDVYGADDAYGLSSPTTDGTRLYISGGIGQVLALNTADGSLAWRMAIEPGVYLNAPAVASGRVFVTAREPNASPVRGTLRAYDAQTGGLLWSVLVSNQSIEYPAMVLGSTVVVHDNQGVVRGFDVAQGQLKWSYATAGYIGHTLAAASGAAFIARATKVTALDIKTGAVLWNRDLPNKQTAVSNPVWANGLVFVAAQNRLSQNAVLALNAKTGKLVSSTPVILTSDYALLSVAGGQVYINTSGKVTALGLAP